MNFLIARTIFFKEMLDTFRDKRTMITMIGVPIVLYPALFIISIQMVMLQESKMDETIAKVALVGSVSDTLRVALENTEQVEWVNDLESPDESLKSGEVDALVRFEDDFTEQLNQDRSAKVTILYDRTEPTSREAENRLYDAFEEINKTLVTERLLNHNLPEGFANPLTLDNENVATTSKSSNTILGSVLPLIMVVMLSLGAFYPAVDLSAGEKERGTFETLLSTPATKLEIVIGKFLAVFSLSLLTGLLNLASMTVTFYFQMSQIANQHDMLLQGAPLISISPLSILGIAVVIIPLAFFISAIMMSIAVLARSFKEAQNYVSPVFILIVLPVSAASFPGIELDATTQFIPLTNVALLFRDLIMGDVQVAYYFTVLMCTGVYALFSLVIATWMFQREEVILSEDKGLPLTLDRRAFMPSHTPTAGTAMGIFAVVMLLLFYAGSYVQGRDIYTGLLLTQYAFILLPVLALLRYVKVSLPGALHLKSPRALSVVAVIITALAWVVINIQLGLWQNKILPIPPDFVAALEALLGGEEQSIYFLIFAIAISPAICEEVLFRGAITSGLRNVFSPRVTILLVGLLFGIFHMSIYRFALTGMTGILLTYFVVRGGSIYLSMVAHFVNNAVAVIVEKGALPESWMLYLNTQAIEENGMPLPWLCGAVVVFVAGLVLFEKSLPHNKTPKIP